MMFIPGRIEVLGKHTDYCGGRSIVCAIDRGFHAEVEPRTDTLVEVENQDTGETISFDLSEPILRPGHWMNYALEVGRRVSANFAERPFHGCRIGFTSDLPRAAGLSSSSALMILIFAALDLANDLRSTSEYKANINSDLELAEYLGCMENGQSFRGLNGSSGVGTFGGSQDHAAILLGKRSTLSRFGFSPLRQEIDYSFPAELSFVIASSGVIAEKTGEALEKYNRLSRMVTEITAAIGNKRSLAQIIDEIGIDEVRGLINTGSFSFQPAELLDRVEQFRVENFEIIPGVGNLLAASRFGEIGSLVDLSQMNAERLLNNQTSETIDLQRSARELGAIAASAFGAGFGGSVYAIVPTSDAEYFASEWRAIYVNRFPQHREASEFFVTRPSQIVLT